MIKRPIHLSHDFLAQVLDDESVVVDATMGNGNDTAFLAGLAKKVYAFDVQEQALEKTRQRLSDLEIENAELILDGHENLDHYVTEPIRAAIFNLGYLPSADKSVITKPHTTLEAIEKILDRLEVGGRLAIMIYYGHDGGDMEKDAVLEYVIGLDQRDFTAMLYQPLNQINTPPFLVMLEITMITDIKENLQICRPNISIRVPRYFEKVDNRKTAKIKKKLASLEVERCHKLLAKEDVTAIDKKLVSKRTILKLLS